MLQSGAVSFAHPQWLWVLPVAVGVPLLAHLLSRGGGRRVVFPGTRFLGRAVAGSSRWWRPRRWFVLALRAALLALIVAAFARPIWRGDVLMGWGRPGQQGAVGGGVATVIVLDRSASMTRPYRGATLFDEARRRAVRVLGSLDASRDRAAVVLLDEAPRSLLPEATGNVSELIQLLGRVEPSHGHGDTDAALRLASVLVRRAAAARTHLDGTGATDQPSRKVRVELFSDLQASQFQGRWWEHAGLTGSSWRVHRVGEGARNVAVSQPRLSPVEPIVGQRAEVHVDVAVYPDRHPSTGDRVDAADPVSVAVDTTFEGRSQTRTVELRPGSVRTVGFTITPRDPGPARLDVGVVAGGDTFDLDNRTGRFFTVRASRRVALVTGADVNDPRRAAYYFARAAAASPDTADPSLSPVGGVVLEHWRSDEIEQRLAGSPRSDAADMRAELAPSAVVIVEAGGLDPNALIALHRYIKSGGAVVWIVDSPEAVAALRSWTLPGSATGVSPIIPGAGVSWSHNADRHLAGGRFDDPLLSVFEGPARGALMRVTFSTAWLGSIEPASVDLLRYNDGSPALACRWIGAGRLAVFGADLSPGASGLVKGPLFVPLLHQLIRGLTPGPPTPAAPHPGEHYLLTLDAQLPGRGVVINGPGGEGVSVAVVPADRQRVTLRFDRLARVGAYQVSQAGDEAWAGGVYVEPDPAESDMRVAMMGPAAIGTTGEPVSGSDVDGVSLSVTGDGLGRVVSQDTRRVELWPYLIAASLLLAGLETLLVGLLGGRVGELDAPVGSKGGALAHRRGRFRGLFSHA